MLKKIGGYTGRILKTWGIVITTRNCLCKADCVLHAHLAHLPCNLRILIRSWSLGETLNDFVNLTEAHWNQNKIMNCIFMFGKKRALTHRLIQQWFSKPEALPVRPKNHLLDIKRVLCAEKRSKCTTLKVKTTMERRKTYVSTRKQAS